MSDNYDNLPATVLAPDWHLEPQIGEQDAMAPACWSMPPAPRATRAWAELGQLMLVAIAAGAVCGWLTLP